MNEKSYLLSSNPIPEGPRIFETKYIVVLPHAHADLEDPEIQEALDRHFRCDWGDPATLTEAAIARQNAGFVAGEEVVSAFEATRPGPCPFFVITDAERTETRIQSVRDDTPEERERTRRFLVDFAAVLKKHGLTIREHWYQRDWTFLGDRFYLDLSAAAAWLDAEEQTREDMPPFVHPHHRRDAPSV
jgi:hypothetical protein